MSIPRPILDANLPVGDWSILTAWRGSQAHGTWIGPKEEYGTDDKDVMAICVPPKPYYLGLETYGMGHRGTKEIAEAEWDIVAYEARKAIALLEKGNPNMLMILWLPDTGYIKRTPAGEILLQNRHMFDGKHVYGAFVGYARGQLHRMTHGVHEGYMGTKRKELFHRYGYDTKNAGHLIRLLRMAVEYLSTGVLNVVRSDASELIDIKCGRWSLEEVKKEADRLFGLADAALINSPLPGTPNHGRISDLTVGVVQAGWRQLREHAEYARTHRLMSDDPSETTADSSPR